MSEHIQVSYKCPKCGWDYLPFDNNLACPKCADPGPSMPVVSIAELAAAAKANAGWPVFSVVNTGDRYLASAMQINGVLRCGGASISTPADVDRATEEIVRMWDKADDGGMPDFIRAHIAAFAKAVITELFLKAR